MGGSKHEWAKMLGATKRSDASAPTPRELDRALYYSTDQDAWAYKTSSGEVKALATRTQAAGAVSFGVAEARPLSAGTDFTDLRVWSWTDLVVSAISADRGGDQLTIEEYRDTPMLKPFLRHDRDSFLCIEYQMPHEWAQTGVRLHAHLIPMAAASGTCQWVGQSSFGGQGDVVPGNSGWTQFRKGEFFYATDQYKKSYRGVVHIDAPAAPGNSDVLSVYLRRAGTSGSDTYTGNKTDPVGTTAAANVCIESLDIHYQRLQEGSVGEFTDHVTNNPAHVLFDPDSWDGLFYLQMHVKTASGNSCTYRLYDVAGSSAVADSTATTTSTVYELTEVGPLTLTSGLREYRIQGKYDSGTGTDEPQLAAAYIVVR
jgi:hypothetical protein